MSSVNNDGSAQGLLGSFPAGDFTLRGWIKNLQASGDACVAGTNGANPYFVLLYNSSGELELYEGMESYGFETLVASPTLGDWIHFAYQREGNTFRWYVRGEGDSSYTLAYTFSSTQGNHTGLSWLQEATWWFPDPPDSISFKNIRLSDGALSTTDILTDSESNTAVDDGTTLWAEWANGASPNPANWHLDTSGNDRHFSASGTAIEDEEDPVDEGAGDITGSASIVIDVTSTSTGTVEVVGSAAPTIVISVAAVGTALSEIEGVGTAVVSVTATSTGEVGVAGVGTAPIVISATSVGAVGITGVSAPTVTLSATSTGEVEVQGSANAPISVGVTSSGTSSIVGVGTATIPISLTSTGTTTDGIVGTASIVVPISVVSAGQVQIVATATPSVAISVASTGEVDVVGSGTAVVPITATAVGTSIEGRVGTVVAVVPITASATGVVPITAQGTADIAITATAQAAVQVMAQAGVTIPILVAGNGFVSITGSGSATIEILVTSVSAPLAAPYVAPGFLGVFEPQVRTAVYAAPLRTVSCTAPVRITKI